MKTKTDFVMCGDRYMFDFNHCTTKNGFAQVDTRQDASYYGNWVNPFKLQWVSYCEGDITVKTAESIGEFRAMVYEFIEWTNNAGYAFLGIDAGLSEKGGSIAAKFEELDMGELLH